MPNEAGGSSVEQIPDEGKVSRAYFHAPGLVAPESYFPFSHDKDRDERAESFIWRRHAPTIEDVHSRGCNIEEIKEKRKPGTKYIGARTAQVRSIRAIVGGRGHKLLVYHLPENGDRAHSHVAIQPANGVLPRNVKTIEILELVGSLVRELVDHQAHDCVR